MELIEEMQYHYEPVRFTYSCGCKIEFVVFNDGGIGVEEHDKESTALRLCKEHRKQMRETYKQQVHKWRDG